MSAEPAGLNRSEEWFDVCDADDRVVDQAPRSVVHARKLLHRATHVFVFNSQGEMWAQMRSATKDESPSTYTSSASGHLSAGEDYLPSAIRELQEEMGLVAELEFVVKLPACEELAWEHTVLYRTVTDDVPTPDPGEVAYVEKRTLAGWAEHLRQRPELFSPAYRTLLQWYLRAQGLWNEPAA